jgi:hypothetical protein
MPEDGNTQSGTSSEATNEELPTITEVQERNLSDGFLQIATEIDAITEETPIEPTPNLLKRILSCFARVLGAFFRR